MQELTSVIALRSSDTASFSRINFWWSGDPVSSSRNHSCARIIFRQGDVSTFGLNISKQFCVRNRSVLANGSRMKSPCLFIVPGYATSGSTSLEAKDEFYLELLWMLRHVPSADVEVIDNWLLKGPKKTSQADFMPRPITQTMVILSSQFVLTIYYIWRTPAFVLKTISSHLESFFAVKVMYSEWSQYHWPSMTWIHRTPVDSDNTYFRVHFCTRLDVGGINTKSIGLA